MATSPQNSKIAQLIAMTAMASTEAKSLLEAFAWDVQKCINFHFEKETTSSHNESSSNQSRTASIGNNVTNERNELRTSSDMTDDVVRAPIPPKEDVLIDTSNSYRDPRRSSQLQSGFVDYKTIPYSVKNCFSRDFKAERRQQRKRSKKSIDELFAPPVDILFNGTFEQLQEAAKNNNKFILVNVQDMKCFESCRLNRDTWSSTELRAILTSNFIFWQIDAFSSTCNQFQTLYPIGKFPHIAIIDYLTGQRMRKWDGFIPPEQLLCKLTEFLQLSCANFVAPKTSATETVINLSDSDDNNEVWEVDRKDTSLLTEEEQMKLAIQQSLRQTETGKPEKNNKRKRKRDDTESETSTQPAKRNKVNVSSTSKSDANANSRKRKRDDSNSESNIKKHKSNEQLQFVDKCKTTNASDKMQTGTGTRGSISLQIRLPGGKKVMAECEATDTLAQLLQYLIDTNTDVDLNSNSYLQSTLLRKAFKGDDLKITLQRAGIESRSVLYVRNM